MVRFLIFIIQLFILVFLTSYLITNSFEVIFEIKELQYSFSSNILLFFTIIFFVFFIFIQTIYFRSRYNLNKYFLSKKSKNLKKGYSYFEEAMIALSNKDNRGAISANNKMKKYLGNNVSLGLLLDAEIYKHEKKFEKLQLVHEEMIKNKNTASLGYKGLMENNLKNQDYHHAFIYGEKLFELNPNIEKIYPTLINIIGKTKNWNQLILLTNKAYNNKIINLETSNKNISIAYYEISKIKKYSEPKEANKLIQKAIKLNFFFPPFIKTHLEILLNLENSAQLRKTIKRYWKNSPNSSLRSVISDFCKENKLDDLESIESITSSNKQEIESKKLLLEFAIINANWSLARENVSGLINNNPDREICKFMALLELGENNDKQKSDAWYLRAENAKLDNIWVCQVTNETQTKWTSVSNSGYFNSLEWMQPKMLSSKILN